MAEMMLQRTRAVQVEPVWSAFISRWPTLDEARRAGDAELAEVLAPLGLNWRIQNIVRLIRSLPDLAMAERLSGARGVGHYVESAVRCFAFGERVPIVDANVVRFYSRVFGFPVTDATRRDREFHAFAESLLPDARWKEYNWALLDITADSKAGEIFARLAEFMRQAERGLPL